MIGKYESTVSFKVVFQFAFSPERYYSWNVLWLETQILSLLLVSLELTEDNYF